MRRIIVIGLCVFWLISALFEDRKLYFFICVFLEFGLLFDILSEFGKCFWND